MKKTVISLLLLFSLFNISAAYSDDDLFANFNLEDISLDKITNAIIKLKNNLIIEKQHNIELTNKNKELQEEVNAISEKLTNHQIKSLPKEQ
ncbi:MAG: hypothetical protein HN826_02205 [Methylococcales bacterium]|jgi:hypothetical protein|nr:hypothetical protein [Methylococcales bacterium]